MKVPPAVGKTVSARVDAELYDALVVLMRAGLSPSEAIKHCVNGFATAVYAAWAAGHYPTGVLPVFDSVTLVPYTPPEAASTDGEQAERVPS